MTLSERWQTFSAAPHRMLMFGGTLQLVAGIGYWLVELTGRYTGLWPPLATTIAAVHAHAYLMLYGLFPFFIFGFLMTTYPRWMGVAEVPRSRYVRTFLLMIAGNAVFYLGLFTAPWAALAGIAVAWLGFLSGVLALLAVYRSARGRDRHYETILNVALGAGALGMALFVAGQALGRFDLVAQSQWLGTWWFLTLVLVTVSHRMLPFFASNVPGTEPVHRPRGGLPLLAGGVVLHGLLVLAGLWQWTWVVDLPLAAVAGYHVWSWALPRSFRARLLAMLHVSFVWLVIALLLSGVRSLAWLATGTDLLARAPLHALGIGFMAGMTLSMATRVTLGHSGRALEVDGITWTLFWLVSVAAAFRVLGELPWGGTLVGVAPTWIAVVVLGLVAALWGLRYGPMYLRPRVDGKAG